MGTESRVGLGWDVHELAEGRPLRIGGVEIEHDRGLLGHSDGDVLLHAVTDALLGAAGEGDIGEHFPDRDPRWKDVASTELLRRVVRLVGEAGWRVVNLDCTVHAEAPRIAPRRRWIRESLARLLEVDEDRINVKAKTGEGLGPVGRREAIEAQAVVLLRR
jgi:2-C-methyl-D-erythritol 2,4-cyclodiphosphate synthase